MPANDYIKRTVLPSGVGCMSASIAFQAPPNPKIDTLVVILIDENLPSAAAGVVCIGDPVMGRSILKVSAACNRVIIRSYCSIHDSKSREKNGKTSKQLYCYLKFCMELQ